jgi:hypothetical protein
LYILEEQLFGFVDLFQKVSIRIRVLERVSGTSQRIDGFREKLPVNESAAAFVHYFLLYLEMTLFLEGFLEFERIRVVDPTVIVVSVAVEGFARIVLIGVAFVTVTVVCGAVCFPIV